MGLKELTVEENVAAGLETGFEIQLMMLVVLLQMMLLNVEGDQIVELVVEEV